jgi:integrase
MMRGSIRKRGRTYTWYLFVLDPATGKPRQRSKGGYRTKRECQAALNDALSTVRTGTFVEASKRTTGSFLRDEWLPAMRLNVRPSTSATYQGLLKAYVIPTLGVVELQQLTPAHLARLYQELLASGRRHRPGGLSAKTVRNVHVLIHRALRDAVRWGYAVRNVADAVDPPKAKPAELQVWTPGQLRAFLLHVRQDRHYAAWLLAATTGMRRGELLGLRRVDVDLAAGRVAVRQPRVVVDHAVYTSEPKTARSRRSIALDPATVAALREHQARQAAERVVIGPGYQDSGLVFTRPDGSPIHPHLFSDWFSSTSEGPDCRRSGSTTCATATRAPRWLRASQPRWSANGSATPPSRSRWTPTATSYPVWTSEPRQRWRSSFSKETGRRARPLTSIDNGTRRSR